MSDERLNSLPLIQRLLAQGVDLERSQVRWLVGEVERLTAEVTKRQEEWQLSLWDSARQGAFVERHECARVCDEVAAKIPPNDPEKFGAVYCAEAIRARGK